MYRYRYVTRYDWKSKKNVEKRGYKNFTFHLAPIEKIPLPSSSVDIIISNCVMNLLPDKQPGFDESYRILKNGGKFYISDIVKIKPFPKKLTEKGDFAVCFWKIVKNVT